MSFSDRHGLTWRKRTSNAPNGTGTYDPPISTADALLLSYRRLVAAEAV